MTSADGCWAATWPAAPQTHSMVVASSDPVAKSVFMGPSLEPAFDVMGPAFFNMMGSILPQGKHQ
jgi:hypothetical protein